MEMDQDLQRRMLEKLRERYPERCGDDDMPGYGEDNYQANLVYLYDHGLVDGTRNAVGHGWRIMAPWITAKGIDFIEDDGGVTAALNTVTVRIDPDQLEQILVGLEKG